METYMSNFVYRLHEIMKDKQINAKQLAQIAGVSGTAVSKWVSGNYFPDYKVAIALAKALKCSVDYLLGIRDDEYEFEFTLSSCFRERFLELLKINKLTAYKLAKVIKIEQSTLSQWVCHNRIPNMQTIIKLCEYFGVSINYILGLEAAKITID